MAPLTTSVPPHQTTNELCATKGGPSPHIFGKKKKGGGVKIGFACGAIKTLFFKRKKAHGVFHLHTR